MNINDWGQVPNTENLPGIPARVTAVHKERYEIACGHGITHGRLKTKEYYVDTVNSGRTATLARRFSHGVTGF